MKHGKGILTVLALSLVWSAAACSSGGDSSTQPVSGTDGADLLAHFDDGGIAPEEGAKLVVWDGGKERPFAEEIVRQFSNKYGIEVTLEEVGPQDQVNRLTNDGPAGLGADVIVMPHDHLGRAVTAGLLLPNDLYGEVTTKENTEGAIIAATSGGKLYGYPRSAETIALYYNKELVPNPPASFDEVISFSQTFTDKSKNKYGLIAETGNFYFMYPFFATHGGYVFGNNGTDKNDIGLNVDGAITGLKVFSSLRQNVLPIQTGDINPDIKRSLFSSGDAAMDLTGPYELAAYKEALGDKLGVAPIPTIAGKPAVSFAGFSMYAVNSYSKFPNAAKLYARFISSRDAQLLQNKVIGSVPTNKEAQASSQVKDDPYIAAFVEQSKLAVPMPSIPEMNNVWAPVGAALSEIWDGGKDPKAAMDHAVQQIREANKGSGNK